MSEKPTISIVMPLFNKEKEVERAIQSVLNQTVSDFELIVVNDGSTDGSPKVVQGIKDHRIRLINQTNGGVSAARNRGIEEAQSELIAFLDADDEWMPDFLETVYRLRDKFPSCDVFATNYLYRNVDGTLMHPIIRGLPASNWEGIFENYFAVASKSDPPIWSSAVAITKKAITSVGGFPVGVTAGEDLLTWAKLALKYQIVYSTHPAAIFWLRSPLWGPPTRLPDIIDIVGQQLAGLMKGENGLRRNGLEKYTALWHRMRASIFIRLGERKAALREIAKALRFYELDLRLYIYGIILLMPKGVFEKLSMLEEYLRVGNRRGGK
jgi:glycosyltransferase involved in cell wall biosynthesis